jgi:spoIIIJ-associated protein
VTSSGPSHDAEPADRLRELVQCMVEACALDGTVEVTEDKETILANVTGDNLGLLIGRRGQTIDALQHLALRIAYRDVSDPRKRVVVDAAGYRDRRAEVLRRQADRAVSEAVEFKRPVALDAMVSAERRLVHEYLRDRPEVETYSEGEEPDRHLVVAPLQA